MQPELKRRPQSAFDHPLPPPQYSNQQRPPFKDSSTTTSPNDVVLELERRFLEFEAVVYPELISSNLVGKNYNNAKTTPKEEEEATTTRDDAARNEVQNQLRRLESVIPNERDPLKRDTFRQRLQSSQLRFNDLNKVYQSRKSVRGHLANRANLFDVGGPPRSSTTLDELSSSVSAKESIKNSNRGADEIIGMGRAVLESLASQGESIRRATGKVGLTGSALGMANSLMRAVRRRTWGDQVLVGAGMVVVTTILVLFYKWVHYND